MVKDEFVRPARRLHEDEASYYKAATRLKLEELKARQEKDLIRLYRKRQRRIWLSKANSIWLSAGLSLKKFIPLKRVLVGTTVVMAIGIIWIAFLVLSHHARVSGVSSLQQAVKPVVPPDGGQKVATVEKNNQKIVTYQDSFAGSSLTITQQKLPDNLKSDPHAITKTDQFKSAVPLDTPKGKLYIVTNTTGQQWAAMAYGDLLMFFQTNKTIDPDNWYKYISGLGVR